MDSFFSPVLKFYVKCKQSYHNRFHNIYIYIYIYIYKILSQDQYLTMWLSQCIKSKTYVHILTEGHTCIRACVRACVCVCVCVYLAVNLIEKWKLLSLIKNNDGIWSFSFTGGRVWKNCENHENTWLTW